MPLKSRSENLGKKCVAELLSVRLQPGACNTIKETSTTPVFRYSFPLNATKQQPCSMLKVRKFDPDFVGKCICFGYNSTFFYPNG